LSPAEATCVHSPGRPALSPVEATCVHSSGRPVLLHSSASSLPGAASSTKALLSTSNSYTPDQSSPDAKAQSQSSSQFGSDHPHTAQLTQQTQQTQLTQQSSHSVDDGWASLEKKTAGYDAQQAAAYSLLCDPRKPAGRRDSDQPNSSNMDSVPEITEAGDQEEEELRQSNMQSLIQKAKALQVRVHDDSSNSGLCVCVCVHVCKRPGALLRNQPLSCWSHLHICPDLFRSEAKTMCMLAGSQV